MVKQYRRLTATIWNEDELASFVKLCSQYWCYGEEKCPTTGKKHYQAYGEFGRQVSFDKIKKLCPTSHFADSKGNAEQNITYCKKDGVFFSGGEPSKQGKRTDIHKVKELVKSGATMEAIIEAMDEPNYQAIRTAEKLKQYLQPKRNCKPHVVWFWGPTGSGKTRTAVETCEELKLDYWMSSGPLEPFWNGYDGQPAIILDDFRAQHCTFTSLLRWLDRYEVHVNTKGGHTRLMATKIFVTSAYPPDEVYRTREDIGQLLRRIDEICHLSEVGGNTNPDTSDNFSCEAGFPPL